MITCVPFGVSSYGDEINLYQVQNKSGAYVRIINWGCTVQSLTVPDSGGTLRDVVLGYDTLAEYEANDGFFGAVLGRYANRIQRGRFTLNGQEYHVALNDGPNHLHGGVRGFDKRFWRGTIDGEVLRFERCSPDGEEGYPGDLDVAVEYSFSDDFTLRIAYEAKAKDDTVINLTNHSYFNLNGHDAGTVIDHELKICAQFITENDECALPTGKLIPTADGAFDFRTGKRIGRDIDRNDNDQIRFVQGYDQNFALDNDGKFAPVALLKGDVSGICMQISTDLPGMQLYTSNGLRPRAGKGGAEYTPRCALCMETQRFPNSTEHKHFSSPVLKKGDTFRTVTEYQFFI